MIKAALQTIQDPELGFSIVDLGLIYDIVVQEEAKTVQITMTMTSPACPLESHFRHEITRVVSAAAPGYTLALAFTFTPPWSPEKAAPHIKEQFALLGIPLTRV